MTHTAILTGSARTADLSSQRRTICLNTPSTKSGYKGQNRWYPVAVVTVAIAISYFDRQTLPVAISSIQRNIPITDEQFSYLQTAFLLSYAVAYIGGGRLLDVLGNRRGFTLIMLWWSIACALHGFASGFGLLLFARFMLGMGEGGGFPAAIRVVAERISPEHRSTAVGIINAGTAVGSVLAPPLIGLVLMHAGWRWVFFLSGGVGIAWVLWWIISYSDTSAAGCVNTSDTRALPQRLNLGKLLSIRSVQTLIFAKFMSDSAWYFLLFWLPKYLYDARHFDIKQVSYYAWIPYAASGVGSFLGGYFSSSLLRRGATLDKARKIALGLSAALMPVVILVPMVPVQLALALFSIAFFCQQSWSGLVMTVPADILPLSAVGTVSGFVGFGGAIGGAVFGLVAGYLLEHGFGYQTLFILVGSFHLIGYLAIVLVGGKIQPLGRHDLKEIEA
jgi:MFS transporter, ACS family, hexuronate transporter